MAALIFAWRGVPVRRDCKSCRLLSIPCQDDFRECPRGHCGLNQPKLIKPRAVIFRVKSGFLFPIFALPLAMVLRSAVRVQGPSSMSQVSPSRMCTLVT
jgi:hypothetical protein